MKILVSILTTLLVLSASFGLTPVGNSLAAPEPPPDTPDPYPGLEEALLNRVQTSRNEVLAYTIYDIKIDNVIPSPDGKQSLLWLALVDRETGETIAAEPGLAIAYHTSSRGLPEDWQITLQSDADWKEKLSAVPTSLISEDLRNYYLTPPDTSTTDRAVYRGYKLPWAGGLAKRLSGSIGHFLIYNSCSETSCRYAYDFADGTMFPLLASKGGTVQYYSYSCPNGDTSCNNYIVLKDASTSPYTYQLYLHLAYNSIPVELRKVGAVVQQGQYIGNVDDTGYSSGHHLHFHVHTNPNSYWGNSVDIRFDDVDINDGVPRTCYEASTWPGYGTGCHTNNLFVSGNQGANPPSGTMVMPAFGENVTDSRLVVAGTATDDRGITSWQVVARPRGGSWTPIGTPLTAQPFLKEVDLCSANLPDGPVEISAFIYDMEGNFVMADGIRSVVKNYACTAAPPPACEPTSSQVALFAEPNYQGACKVLGIGDYSQPGSFSTVGDNNTASIKIGANVRAVLFDQTDYTGRTESLEANDPNLTDNILRLDHLTSLKVQDKATVVGDPVDLVYPPADTTSTPDAGDVTLPATSSIDLTFRVFGATNYKFNLDRWNGSTWIAYAAVSDQPFYSYSVGSLPPGQYRWRARGSNSADSWGNGTATSYFTVDASTLPELTPKSLPYTDSFDTDNGDWFHSGLWHWDEISREAGNYGWVYNNGSDLAHDAIRGGDLTSPPVALPAGQPAYLRFKYQSDTESPYRFWDQRRIQISVDGGVFNDLPTWGQLWDDPVQYWLNSPVIDLSGYAGHTVRIRFHFYSVDNTDNSGLKGWEIDDFSITTTPGETCQENPANNTVETAVAVNLGSTVSGQTICPAGDVDYYKFSGTAGQRVILDVDAYDLGGSTLDAYLFLMDASGKLIAENDDQVFGVVRDPLLGTTLPYTGTYTVRIRAWDHPGAGGSSYSYSLRLVEDSIPPSAQISYPVNQQIPAIPFSVHADANDGQSGVVKVDFYWHSSDWTNGAWVFLGSDTNGTDGWSWAVTPASLGSMTGSAFYIQAWDAAGNQFGDMITDLVVDSTLPTSALNSLPATSQSTLIPLSWSASDTGSGLASFTIQYKDNGSAWLNWATITDPNQRSASFFGVMGHSYQFRMIAVDMAGNQEAYPTNAEASTTIAACTPDAFDAAGDDTLAGAQVFTLGSTQEHNQCETADTDWIYFDITRAAQKVMIVVQPISGNAAANLTLYAPDRSTQLAQSAPPALGQTSAIVFTAADTGTYYLEISPLVNELAGTDVKYRLWIGEPLVMWLPVIHR